MDKDFVGEWQTVRVIRKDGAVEEFQARQVGGDLEFIEPRPILRDGDSMEYLLTIHFS